ncbi:TspO/MBR family protein [Candidatus Contubernalis alkaliaceticus]|uniref:TspO/MBR family protein n=1 Tax=Candidatus Contubernalis alkaliaceticus TaxID=338645 RepID=UPI001F4C336F|nr:TspO/MBR family protein [Candidatus Contubernalis alkalaceticus]UNC91064.1 tryptophan-rich sensory protein [Candidatus Contubernalis alkalaceticus]
MKYNWVSLQITNIVTFAGVVIVNFLANTLPINGVTTGDVSDSYPNLFAPAGFTFAIWVVIYLLLAAFVVYQAKGLFRKSSVFKGVLKKVSIFFAASSIFNIAWVFAWHYRLIGLSLIFMFLIFISLAVIYIRIKKVEEKPSRGELIFFHIPFSVYFGWISIAMIANITTYLVSIQWQGFNLPDAFWAVLIILTGALLAAINTFIHKDIAFLLVFFWAFIGIAVQRIITEQVYYSILFAVTISFAMFGILLYRLYASKAVVKKGG